MTNLEKAIKRRQEIIAAGKYSRVPTVSRKNERIVYISKDRVKPIQRPPAEYTNKRYLYAEIEQTY